MQHISIKTAAVAAHLASHSRFFVFFWGVKGRLCHNSENATQYEQKHFRLEVWQDGCKIFHTSNLTNPAALQGHISIYVFQSVWTFHTFLNEIFISLRSSLPFHSWKVLYKVVKRIKYIRICFFLIFYSFFFSVVWSFVREIKSGPSNQICYSWILLFVFVFILSVWFVHTCAPWTVFCGTHGWMWAASCAAMLNNRREEGKVKCECQQSRDKGREIHHGKCYISTDAAGIHVYFCERGDTFRV